MVPSATEVNPEELNTSAGKTSSLAICHATPQFASLAPQQLELDRQPTTPVLTKDELQPAPFAFPEEPVSEWDALRTSSTKTPTIQRDGTSSYPLLKALETSKR